MYLQSCCFSYKNYCFFDVYVLVAVGVVGSLSPYLGSLSRDVFERSTSTGSEPFSLLISLDATIFVLPSVLILIEIIFPKNCSKSRLKSAKSQLPVDVSRCYLNTLLICYTC